MKAALYYKRHDIRVEEFPDPIPGPEDVILKVEYCGICGTDLEEYRHGPIFIPMETPNPLTGVKAPLVLGHEFIGEVVEVGNKVSKYKVGDRLAPDVLLYCGECYWCKRHQVTLCDQMAALGLMGHGGLAQYCKAPVSMCIKVPNTLRSDHAALAEPLSVAVRAVRKGRIQLGDVVAIFGGGTIGLLALQVARHAGAAAVYLVEPDPYRRKLAMQLGAAGVIDPQEGGAVEQLLAITCIGADVTIEATGVPAVVPQAIEATRKAGRVVLVGLPTGPSSFNFLAVVATEKEIVGSLSHVYDEDFWAAIRMLADGRIEVDALISDRIPLDDLVARGLNRLGEGRADVLKILVMPNA